MKSITLALVAFLLVGLASADNYVGDAKGPDDPRASLVGYNQSQIMLSGAMSMDIGNQALGKIGLDVIELSGTDPDIFNQFQFKKDGIGDGGSYGAWKPGM